MKHALSDEARRRLWDRAMDALIARCLKQMQDEQNEQEQHEETA